METAYAKEGTEVLLSVRGKMMPAQVRLTRTLWEGGLGLVT